MRVAWLGGMRSVSGWWVVCVEKVKGLNMKELMEVRVF